MPLYLTKYNGSVELLRMKKFQKGLLRNSIVCLAVCAQSVLAQTNQNNTAASKPTKQPASAGLVNDWLRKQSPEFTKWDIGGQLRLRYELKDNAGYVANRDFTHKLDNDDDFLMFREKIHIGFTPVSWLTFYVEGRDASSGFDKRDPSPNSDLFDLHQAFISIGDTKKFPLLLKVGRQELRYGDERFVGIGDWGNTGRSFDAVKLRFENDLLWVDAFMGRVVVAYDDHFNEDNEYDNLFGVYASTRKLVSWQDTDLYFLARTVSPEAPNAIATGVPGSPSSARDVYTVGTRFKSLSTKLHGWDYTTEVALQFGSVVQSGERRDLEAMMADANAGYTWKKVFGSPRLGLGYTYASGDSDPNDNKDETFESLFGTNHKFYGLMDLWGLRNIHSGRVVGSIKPWKQLTLATEYHLIWLADTHDFFYPESGSGRSGNGYGRKPQNDSFVGSELDFLVTFAPTSFTEFQVGYGHFFVGDYIRQSVDAVAATGGYSDADWFYLQIKFNF